MTDYIKDPFSSNLWVSGAEGNTAQVVRTGLLDKLDEILQRVQEQDGANFEDSMEELLQDAIRQGQEEWFMDLIRSISK